MRSRAVTDERRGTGPGVTLPMALLGPSIERWVPGIFSFLRRRCPVVRLPGFAVVVRDADVRQVLGRRHEFSVEHYTHKVMEVTGHFALGLDATEHHGPALALIGESLLPDDLGILAERAHALASEALDFAAARGSIDVLSEFADPVLARLVGDYLGVTGLDWQTLVSWSHTIFTEIFVSNVPYVRPAAMEVTQRFRAHIDGLIAARKAGLTAGDDALDRMIAAGTDPDSISGTLLGLVVAWIPNSAKTLALVVDELLRRPAELAAAQSAARTGDRATLGAILFEASRFRPQTPGIMRVAAHSCRVGLDRAHPKTIRAGATVLAATASAMMDEDAIEAPRHFKRDRPWTDYLHFGYGMHTCAGMAISRAVLPELGRALLSRGPLRRAKGRAGRIRWRYPYPSHLAVRFAPERKRGGG